MNLEHKHLAAAVVANRRMLKLLDQQIDELAKIEPEVAASLSDPDRHQPFSYTAEGVDGKAGIVMTQNAVSFQNPNYGYIRMQSDAAFVATRMFTCAVQSTGEGNGSSIDAPTYDRLFDGLELRVYDESSQRWLFIANNRQLVQQNTAVPASLLGALPISSSGGIELPSECTFPRNALLRVEAYQQSSVTSAMRIHFILHGYKVFGG